ncbi:MAG: glycoside hydrolase family 28 protein [Verrucomicrobiota bacterium JB022]|nr:glycoside hydrolase family 28 protein [Verrucomicrobiota bacterium JB022]
MLPLRLPLLGVFCATLVHLVTAVSTPSYTQDGRLWGGDPIAPIKAPFSMPELQRPDFGSHVVNIRDYGAKEGGKIKNTEAIAKAIAACAEAGGGRVVVPAGKWLTGPIHFKSNIELHLAEGAEVIFSDRYEDYLPVVLQRVGGIEIYNYSPLVYARDCENVGITGPGKLNGNAEAWWGWKKKESSRVFQSGAQGIPVEERIFGTPEDAVRPSFVVFLNCRNVLMEGFTIGSGPNWTIHPIYSENIIIRRVQVLTDGPNNDGIDPDSCRNVLIEHCVFDTGDDCVVLKSGYNQDGWRVGKPTENVVMRWCSSKRGHGGLVIGSEMSGDVRNVYMYECEFEGTDRAVRLKSRADRGGVVENVWAENLKVKDMQYEVVILNMDYSADKSAITNPHPPVFRNIHIRNIEGDGAPEAIKIVGMKDSLIEDVTFENIRIRSQKGAFLRNVTDVTFENVEINPSEGAAFILDHATDVTIRNATATPGTAAFVRLEGSEPSDVEIKASKLEGAREAAVIGQGAQRSSVVIKP